MTGSLTITITYPTPATQPDIDAVKFVLIAADPYRVADYSSESTPGKVVFTIDAAGGPELAHEVAQRFLRWARRRDEAQLPGPVRRPELLRVAPVAS